MEAGHRCADAVGEAHILLLSADALVRRSTGRRFGGHGRCDASVALAMRAGRW